MTGFSCEYLPPAQAGTVFPLLREAIPGLELQAWLRHARRIADPRRAAQSGVIVVRRDTRPMPCGLFIYHREQDLQHGTVLVAEHIVAIDLLDAEPVMRVLVAELEVLAQRLECNGIRAMLIGPDAPIAAQLRAAGHARQGESLWKELGDASARPPRRG